MHHKHQSSRTLWARTAACNPQAPEQQNESLRTDQQALPPPGVPKQWYLTLPQEIQQPHHREPQAPPADSQWQPPTWACTLQYCQQALVDRVPLCRRLSRQSRQTQKSWIRWLHPEISGKWPQTSAVTEFEIISIWWTPLALRWCVTEKLPHV